MTMMTVLVNIEDHADRDTDDKIEQEIMRVKIWTNFLRLSQRLNKKKHYRRNV